MNIAMTFPDTVDEFMEQYKMTDTECVYSNGIEYVPIFRMKQWFKHLEAKTKTNENRIRSMTEIKIKIDDYGYVYAEMPDGTIRQLLADVYGNPYFSKILLGKEVEAEKDKDGGA